MPTSIPTGPELGLRSRYPEPVFTDDEADVEVGMTTRHTNRKAVITREYELFKSSFLKLRRSVA